MITLPEPASEAVKWALVVGLSFYSADACCALIQQKLAVPAKPLTAAVVPNVQQGGVPPQAVPPGLVSLLATTRPEGQVGSLPGADPTNPSAAPGTPAQPTAPPSNLQLRGTMAGDGGNGLAMIDVNGQTQVFGTGEQVAGLTVMEVSAYSVRLEGNGQVQILEMDSSGPVAAATLPVNPNPAQPNPMQTPMPTPSASPAEGAGAILTQRELREILNNPAGFADQGFRMKPVLSNGEIVGMRVALQPAHPLARLGIQDGDIVKSLNGTPINGPEALSSLYRVLRNTSSLSFEVDRNGTAQKVEVTLEE